MQKSNAEILHHFYSLLLEINFHETEDDAPTVEEISDPFLQKHLRLVKLKIAKHRADAKRTTYQSLLTEIDRLRKLGSNELKKLLSPKEALQFQPLFSKFESMTEKDKESIAEDQELLQLITALKDKLKKPDQND